MQITPQQIHDLLTRLEGDRDAAVALLVDSGIEEMTRRKLDQVIKSHGALNATWNNSGPVSNVSAPTDQEVNEERQLAPFDASNQFMITQAEKFNAAEGMANAGVQPDKVQAALGFSEFARNSFAMTIDMIHGMMVVDAQVLHDRAAYIKEKILENTDMVNKTFQSKDGPVVKQVPKFSEEDKLEWQKEYLGIMQEIRKFSETANNAALTRIKAQVAANEIGDGARASKPKRKLKRVN
jgi:hypothetical protein